MCSWFPQDSQGKFGRGSWIIGGSGGKRLPLFPGRVCDSPEGSPKNSAETVGLSEGLACDGFLYFRGAFRNAVPQLRGQGGRVFKMRGWLVQLLVGCRVCDWAVF